MSVVRGLILLSTLVALPANFPAIQQSAPAKLEVVWKAGGGDDAATSFASILSIAVSPTTGNVVVWDQKTPALRMYDPRGKLVRDIGRKGAGPGEWTEVNGLAFLKDGRLLEWDAGNARINIYKPNGDAESSWIAPFSGTYTTNGLTVDPRNRAYLSTNIWKPDRSGFNQAWLRVDALTGKLIDTVLAPQPEGSDPPLMARTANGSSSRNLPYGKFVIVALNTNGVVMWGPGDQYIVNTEYNGKPIQIRRAYTPVPVPSAERAELRANIEWSLRSRQPAWTWTGRDVPGVKPPYAALTSGMDGRIWVSLNVESEKFTPETPRGDPKENPPLSTFRGKDRRWDVFEPDGRFVVTVVGARNVRLMVMQGDDAWGVMTDADDLPVLVKFRIASRL